jgi:LysM repeat protein
MTIDLIDIQRRLLRVQNVVGENTRQVKILNEITFPVQVKKIWDTIAMVRDVKHNIINDKVIIEGTVHKQIFFVAGENEMVDGIKYQKGGVYELSVDEKFLAHLDIPGARPGHDIQVNERIEYISYDEMRSGGEYGHHHKPHNWRQTLILEIFVKVTETVQMEIVTDVIAPSLDIEVIKELLKLQSVVGEDVSQTSIIRDIKFDRKVKKIRNIQTKVEDVTTKIVPDKVIIEGNLHKQVYYVEHESNRVFEQTINEKFTAFVDIPGARPGQNVQVSTDVEFVDIDLRDGSSGHGFRVGRQTAVLAVFAKVTEELQIDVVIDVIGDVDVFKELLKVESVVSEDSRQVTIKENVVLSRPAKKVAQTDSEVKINFTETKVIKDKVIVIGELKKQIYYVDLCEGGLWEQGVVEKFTTFVDLPGAREGMNLSIDGEVEFVEYEEPKYPHDVCKPFEWGKFDPERYPWKQTAIVQVFVKVTETLQLDVVTDVVAVEPPPVPEPEPEPEPGECPPGATIKIIFVQKGDSLFKLAQRFGTTVEELLTLNPGIDPKNLQVGQKIRVPCQPTKPKG